MVQNVEIPIEIDNYEKKIYDQEQLINISKALSSQLELDSLIEAILNTTLAQSRTFQNAIYLTSGFNKKCFVLNDNYTGFEKDDSIDYRISVKSEFISWLAKLNRAMYLEEMIQFSGLDGSLIENEVKQLYSFGKKLLLVPLVNKDKINGFMVLGEKANKQEYEYSEKTFLENLAAMAAIAVENARLYEMATVDMMTHLKMKHVFNINLAEELIHAKENAQPLSIYMTDIDNFKSFNDTYGHQLGDKVLIKVASQLLKNSRGRDVACRFGGEEFIVLLPGISLLDAKKIAERTRIAVENQVVVHQENNKKQNLKVTISIGVAQYDPDRDKSVKDLIERSDKALYVAKRNGKNQVALSEFYETE